MPLVQSKYDLVDSDGDTRVSYTTWHRTPPAPGTVEPLFVPANLLEVTLEKGATPVQYAPGEVSQSTIANPSLTALTIVVAKSIDAGGEVFTVLLPAPPSLAAGKTEAKVEAVAFTTKIRTFLVDVGDKFPSDEFHAKVLRGTYSEGAPVPPGAG